VLLGTVVGWMRIVPDVPVGEGEGATWPGNGSGAVGAGPAGRTAGLSDARARWVIPVTAAMTAAATHVPPATAVTNRRRRNRLPRVMIAETSTGSAASCDARSACRKVSRSVIPPPLRSLVREPPEPR
jgi:hypothetical protein